MQVENSVKPNKRFIIEDLGNGKWIIIPLKFTLNKKNQNMVKFI